MTLQTPFIPRITSPAYYCEVDAYAAEFLRNLVAAGQIAPGDVDERSIEDVAPDDLRGFAQCHFFAGVGVWSYAARLAGWPDGRPLWTGSCPCQPFSAAGKGAGVDDVRHLWPAWHWLIEQCRPETVFGEQVASKDGLGWFDIVAADMEATDYAIGAVDTCAAGFGGFHIRQRLYFAGTDDRVADAVGQSRGLASGCDGQQMPETVGGREAGRVGDADGPRSPVGVSKALGQCEGHPDVADNGSRGLSGSHQRQSEVGRMDNAGGIGRHAGRGRDHGQHERVQSDAAIADGGVAVATDLGCDGWPGLSDKDTRGCGDQSSNRSCVGGTCPVDLGRQAADWLFCRDGRWRPVEPGTFPLAHEATARVGRLRAYGNGLDAGQAAAFIAAFLSRDSANLDAVPAGDLFEWGVA